MTSAQHTPASDGAQRRIVSVILAAGKGTRMRSPDRHKVCTPLAGRPVIEHALSTYVRCGIDAHMLVVGAMAEQVMQAACAAPGRHTYVFQAEQRGTGHATRVAAEALRAMGYDGDVLVVAGDKVIEAPVLQRLIAGFRESGADLAFLAGDVRDFPTAGRVVPGPAGAPRGIVEVFDIGRMQVLLALRRMARERLVPPEEAERLALATFGRENKAATALGPLWDAIRARCPVTMDLLSAHFSDRDFALRVNGEDLSPETLADVTLANLSVYLFRAEALYAALDQLGADNAQQEEYLTDAVGILSAMGRRVRAVPIARATEVMAFNTPEEFEAIVAHVEQARRATTAAEQPRTARLTGEWLRTLKGAPARRALSAIYGDGGALLERKRHMLVSALESYRERFGDGPVRIARAPGRLNVMGRHVDHQGGAGNLIAIDRDTFIVMGARADREVRLASVEPHQFPERAFSIDETLAGYNGGDWLEYVNSAAVRDGRASLPAGDWAQYARAAVARLQAHAGRRRLSGFNAVVAGDIPIAAGLSSSSALVVATAEGLCAENDLVFSPEEFVRMCGEGEWYVGTRGGAGDHAAMKMARKGHVVQFGSLPFGVLGVVPFPEDHVFVVCNSHVKARKTAGAKDVFNHRVACYHVGREIFKAQNPDLAPLIAHLRDVNAGHLGLTLPDLLRRLRRLPESLSRDEVLASVPEEVAQTYLTTHADTFERYPIRSVVVFGLAECERSRACADLLRGQDVEAFGRWMDISHDGDRVTAWDDLGNTTPFCVPYDDAAMDAWIARAEGGHAGAALALQPGAYSCSTPAIDRMVDAAKSVPGVRGAQLSGAGLGGCIMALVHRDAVEDLERTLLERYYGPLDLEPEVFACTPVAGSGLLAL